MKFEGFTINDVVNSSKIPRAVDRATKILNKLPLDELLTGKSLADQIGIMESSFAHHASSQALKGYRFTHKGKTLWGSKRTIEKLKRKLEKL